MKKINNQNVFYEYSEAEELGSGAFASVYKGISCQDKSKVAIKVINRQKLKKYGDEIISAIGDEVNILQKISKDAQLDPCPYIVKIYDCFQTTNNIYIVLEFCNGGSLLEVMKDKKKLSEEEAIKILYQIMSAVAYMSKHDIVHRDIKPENIFINNGIYKLGDFGFASQKNTLHTTLGTYPYMAPEFFKEPSYNKSVDVWAVGVMYHEMLFNELYFIGLSQYEVSQNICNKVYVIPSDPPISEYSKQILKGCIEKDRDKRAQAEDLIKHVIFDSLRNDPSVNPSSEQAILQQQKQNSIVNLQIQLEFVQRKIINTRNGLLFLVQLAELLEGNFNNDCKFDIFFLLRKALSSLNGIVSSLMSKQAPNFLVNETASWNYYIQTPMFQQVQKQLEMDRVCVCQKFSQNATFMDVFLRQYFPDNYHNMSQIINNNLDQIVPPEIYNSRLQICFQYFQELYQKSQDARILSIILQVLISQKIEVIIQKDLIDFQDLQQKAPNFQVQDIQNYIQLVNSFK